MVKGLLKGIGLLFLLLFVVVLAGGAWFAYSFRASLPWIEGERTAQGLTGQASITRDARGIPHISGQTDEDVYFALGYAHAQDRLWQMTFNRRLIDGRLAEILGQPAVSTDVLFRAYDLGGAAERSLADVSPETVAVLEAYARGVNALLADPDFKMPPEFVLLRSEPEPWTPADSIKTLKLMGLSLSLNASREFQRAELRAILGAEKAAEFLDPEGFPRFVSLAAADLGLPASVDAPSPPPGGNATNLDGEPAEQSNNWVVDGTRTTSGAPLLANDPHLRTSMPGIWYLAHLAFEERGVTGVTLPGIPSVLLGHNGTVAWAFTNTGPDIQDLIVMTRDPDDANRYATETGTAAFSRRTETITVRGGDALDIELKATPQGPVMPKEHTRFADLGAADQEVVLAWTLLSDADRSVETAIGLMHVNSYEEGRALGRSYDGPMQSILYADVQGTIGFMSPGTVPLRAAGHDTQGRFPVDGTFARNAWTGSVPYDGLPFVKNPADGLIVTANNQITPDGYPHALTNDWNATERARRIDMLLRARDRHDAESFAEIQQDFRSLRATRLVPLLTAVPAPEGAAREARALVAAWDGTMAGDQPEPLIYVSWVSHLSRLITADDFGADFPSRRSFRQDFLVNVLSGKDADWCDVTDTPGETETCEPLVAAALESTVKSLSERYGADMTAWRWDAAHHVRFPHQPFDRFPVLGQLFSRSVPMGGGVDTVNVAPFRVDSSSARYDSTHTASLRAIYDLDDLSRSRFMITTGQSGHVLSPHYDDLIEPWVRGDSFTITAEPAELAVQGRTLTLRAP